MKKRISIALIALFLGLLVVFFVSISTWAGGGESFVGFTRLGGTDNSFFYIGGAPTSRLFIGFGYTPPNPDQIHIIAITQESISVAWTITTFVYSQLVYKTGSYPVNAADGTVVYSGLITSATADNLTAGTTYYFGVWGHDGAGTYSAAGSFVVGTTHAGNPSPSGGESDAASTDDTILGNSPIGGFIDFISTYAQLPEGTVGLLGYGAILIFVLVAVAMYNRSTAAVVVLSLAGMALGRSLGLFATVFLVVALIVGGAIAYLRGGQPTGG